MNALVIEDVRAAMPNYARYSDHAPRPSREGSTLAITGIAIHHSALVHEKTGLSRDSALSISLSHIQGRGWEHGGYHYFVRPTGKVEYALDENILGLHAGFRDPENRFELENGQYWNNHYLAICVLGWFDDDRVVIKASGERVKVPNYFTRPSAAQLSALIQLVEHLRQKHSIAIENVQGHRELAGCATRCPGYNFELVALRKRLGCSALVNP